MQCVIFCGGYATRLYPLTKKIPKSMLLFNGKPFLEHQLELLKKNRVADVVLITGFLQKRIIDYFGNGKDFGVNIQYCKNNQKFGTAYGLVRAKKLLDDAFLLMYGDSYLRIDYAKVFDFFVASGALGLMTAYTGSEDVTKHIEVKNNRVTKYYSKEERAHPTKYARVDYGLSALRKKALAMFPITPKTQHGDLFNFLSAQKQLVAFEAKKPYFEVGSFSGMREFEEFASKNLD